MIFFLRGRHDFLPSRTSKAETPAPQFLPVLARLGPSPSPRPLNILMIVMESVGSHRLGLYGAPYDDSPEISRLARHGAVFDQVYVSFAATSPAMGALFCSLYPEHGWYTMQGLMPNIGVPGLAQVLADHGYRTGFIHSGTMEFDNQGEFLHDHGFADILSEPRDYDAPRDAEMLPKALNWIKADPSKPFFLTLWTQDTHHPYVAAKSRDYGEANPYLNRYLNAVRTADDLIGNLARALDEMKLTNDTLIVITGDHGEAFGEHSQTAHGFSVYQEEISVPFVFVNPRLFPQKLEIKRMGRQIDFAPTILSMLGYEQPSAWQGTSLFATEGPTRAYLFSAKGNSTLGLIEGSYKYIYDFNLKRAELYDITADPSEQHDLSSNPTLADMMQRDHLRLEAWLKFQNAYLAGFASSHRVSVRNESR
jgi:lipoteichoic acid synthase